MSIIIYAVSVGQYDDFGYVGFFTKEADAVELVQYYKHFRKYPENKASYDELAVSESFQEHMQEFEAT